MCFKAFYIHVFEQHAAEISTSKRGTVYIHKRSPFFLSSKTCLSRTHHCRRPYVLDPLASCLIYTWAFPAHPYNMLLSILWVRSFVEPYLFDNNVPFYNTTPIYLINIFCKLG